MRRCRSPGKLPLDQDVLVEVQIGDGAVKVLSSGPAEGLAWISMENHSRKPGAAAAAATWSDTRRSGGTRLCPLVRRVAHWNSINHNIACPTMIFEHAREVLLSLEKSGRGSIEGRARVLLPAPSDLHVGANNQASQRTNMLSGLPAEGLLPANCGQEHADSLWESLPVEIQASRAWPPEPARGPPYKVDSNVAAYRADFNVVAVCGRPPCGHRLDDCHW